MRELLFRGKRIDNGEWVYGSFTNWYQLRFNSDTPKMGIATEFELVYHDCVPETVGEYTGLCDKNGKRIFEGDILEFTYNDVGKSLNTGLYTVQWSDNYDNYAGWVIQENTKGINPDKMDYWNGNCFEVIGNIYDNPELLQLEKR